MTYCVSSVVVSCSKRKKTPKKNADELVQLEAVNPSGETNRNKSVEASIFGEPMVAGMNFNSKKGGYAKE